MAPAEHPMLEGYTALGFLAAHTSSVRLGLLVTGVTYRHPGLLAKIVSTLDVLSGGRAALGIGAAWYEREHRGLGVQFPPVAERFERLEEALQICLQMWDPTENGRYDGRHYQLAETLCSPQPLSQPHPPIMIGGSGERKTLRLVARYADACNLFGSSTDEVAHKLDVLRRHCDEVGRDGDEIVKTTLYTGGALDSGDIDDFVTDMAGYAKLGIDGVMVMPLTDRPADWVEQRCIPAAARLAELS
jgi:F420-dependent oxidoreductase-like protein